MLIQEPQLQDILLPQNCMKDPVTTFIKAVIEPLSSLRRCGQVGSQDLIILVDSLDQAAAQCNRRDSRSISIVELVTQLMSAGPPWMRWLISLDSYNWRDTLSDTHCSVVDNLLTCCDLTAAPNTNGAADTDPSYMADCDRDVMEYVAYRLHMSNDLNANVGSVSSSPNTSLRHKFQQHVVKQSQGNFLYCKLVLDLVENGHLVLKSSNFKILPVDLHEVLLLTFNLKYPR